MEHADEIGAIRHKKQSADDAVLKLGGINLYSANESSLVAGVEALCSVIRQVSAAHASMDKTYLRSEVGRHCGTKIERRVFSAVLGRVLRMGWADVVPCEALSGDIFRVVVSGDCTDEFVARTEEVRDLLREDCELLVRDVRDRYWGRSSGAWTYASHICGRVVARGWGEYVDRYTVAWPIGIVDAIR